MKNVIVCAFGTALLVVTASPSRAITISLDPATQSAAAGSTVDVALVVADLGDGVAPSLSTFDVDIAFDAAVLSFFDATFGDPALGDQLDLLGLGGVTGATPGAGSVNLFELSFDLPSDLDDLQAGSFVLATLRFNAVGPGLSPLFLTVNALGDANGDPLTADVTGGNVTVTSTSVPEPSSLILILSALAGLALARGRQSPGGERHG